MKILFFCHSGASGGAENALRHLVKNLMSRHEVHLVLPSLESHEGLYFKNLGLRCFELKFDFLLPHFSNVLLAGLRLNIAEVIDILGREQYDVFVSNTLAILHGNMLAHLMAKPHVTYVHEFLDDDELLPNAIQKEQFLKLVEDGSSGLMACSKMVIQQFAPSPEQPRLVLPPFDYSKPLLPRELKPEPENVLQIVGVQTYRKNIVFATAVVKALRLLGHSVRLDIIGRPGSASAQIQAALSRRGVVHRIHPHLQDPYAQNQGERVITLVCATSEPYGLTIPESLRLGIPVVSSDCGGPSELLSQALLYPVDDVDGCVRILSSIWNNYPHACEVARRNYQELSDANTTQTLTDKLDAFLLEASLRAPSKTSELLKLFQLVRAVAHVPIDLNQIKHSIATVATRNGCPMTTKNVDELIEQEQRYPGAGVMQDVRAFNAIPFGNSSAIADLYRNGVGLAIELAADFSRPERLQMIAYVACSLWQETRAKARSLKVLALGDGIGLDSIRLAHAGFDVDYIDYENSAMAQIALENFAAYGREQVSDGALQPRMIQNIERQYDAVVCLEVIEHVPNPEVFIDQIAQYLVDDGVVLISECFNGVEDRWPTHLATNERYAGLLPFMMHHLFRFESLNRQPQGKPFVFRKRRMGECLSTMSLLNQRGIMVDLIRQQLSIGL